MEAIPFGEDEPTQLLEMPRQSTFETEKSVREQPVQGTPRETPGHDLIHASNRAIHPEVCSGRSLDTLLSLRLRLTGLYSRRADMSSPAYMVLDKH